MANCGRESVAAGALCSAVRGADLGLIVRRSIAAVWALRQSMMPGMLGSFVDKLVVVLQVDVAKREWGHGYAPQAP